MEAATRHAKIRVFTSMIRNDIPPPCDSPKGVAHPGVIDFLAFDSKLDEVLMLIVESRPWTGGEQQHFQLQEKLNAYLSFILDGEMLEAYPDFNGKNIRIRLECNTPPTPELIIFLQVVYDQLALQGVAFEVEAMGKACGSGNPGGLSGEA